MPDVTTIAYWGLPLVTGTVAYAVARLTGSQTAAAAARAAAETALIKSGPEIIEAQNKRLDAYGAQIDRLWEELRKSRKAEEECQNDLWDLRRRVDQRDGT